MSEEIVLSDRNVPRTPLHEELTRLYSQGYMTVSDCFKVIGKSSNPWLRELAQMVG